MNEEANNRQIFSVTELNRQVRQILDSTLPLLWVEGEISNFVRPGSGHWYLTLKDEKAQVRCAMFKGSNIKVGFQPSNGMSVLVRCKAGIYEGRGEYQLVIEHMEEAGFGALQRQFDQLKVSLSSEGLFDPSHKKEMPRSVGRIGVVTSPTGAAVKDILSVLKRRFPSINVSIYPSSVQGDLAAGQIVSAIDDANSDGRCDALIVGRGGGSLEDLWPFNEESVARAIFHSRIPIISAVGHEIDFTIADFVADLRAPTPSAAAELISPDSFKIKTQLQGFETLLTRSIVRQLQVLDKNVINLQKRLQHPGRKLQEQAQHLDHLEIRLNRAMHAVIKQSRQYFISKSERLLREHPKQGLTKFKQQLNDNINQLSQSAGQQLKLRVQRTGQTLHLLDAVSPLRILERGFSVIRDKKNQVIRTIESVCAGDSLKSQVEDGEIYLDVTSTAKKDISNSG